MNTAAPGSIWARTEVLVLDQRSRLADMNLGQQEIEIDGGTTRAPLPPSAFLPHAANELRPGRPRKSREQIERFRYIESHLAFPSTEPALT